MSSNSGPYNEKLLLASIICLSVAVVFVLLLHVYARWLLGRRPNVVVDVVWEPNHGPATTLPFPFPFPFPGHGSPVATFPGLDAKEVASLPVFLYGREEHGAGMSCVVCLGVMEEGEKGRAMPNCNHKFHIGCIDVWLMSHSTCPICRDVVVVVIEDEVEPSRVCDQLELVAPVSSSSSSSTSSPKIETASSLSSTSTPIPSSSSSSSSPSPFRCSLKRMLSRSRSERRVLRSRFV